MTGNCWQQDIFHSLDGYVVCCSICNFNKLSWGSTWKMFIDQLFGKVPLISFKHTQTQTHTHTPGYCHSFQSPGSLIWFLMLHPVFWGTMKPWSSAHTHTLSGCGLVHTCSGGGRAHSSIRWSWPLESIYELRSRTLEAPENEAGDRERIKLPQGTHHNLWEWHSSSSFMWRVLKYCSIYWAKHGITLMSFLCPPARSLVTTMLGLATFSIRFTCWPLMSYWW